MSSISSLKKFEHVQVSVSFVKDTYMKKLNKEHLKKDYTTDVLSFNLNQELSDNKYYLGDVVVNLDQAERQAKEYNNSVEEEVAELVEHGVLHLLGIHHDGDDH